jgi:hypothetical protein
MIHRVLAHARAVRLEPRRTIKNFEAELQRETSVRRVERTFVQGERATVAKEAAAAPREPVAFLNWFESLNATGLGQNDALFPWLAEHSNREQMSWFLRQDLANETAFGDLVALTQIKMPMRPKLELARNYWAEVGRGIASEVHSAAPDSSSESAAATDGGIVWESLALGNLMVALATARHYAYQSLGAWGVVELTAPGRAALISVGLKRLGMGGAARAYYDFSASLDARHSAAWNREVLQPLVAGDASLAPVIAEGALLRLRAGQRCYERYRKELWGRAHVVATFEFAEDAVAPSAASETSESAYDPPLYVDMPAGPPIRAVRWRDVSGPRAHRD